MAKRAEKKDGLFCQITQAGKMGVYTAVKTDNSEAVQDGDGKVRNYEHYDEIGGKLVSVYVFDKALDAGKEFEMFVVNMKNKEGQKESLSMPFKSGYAQSLIKRLENIDLSKEVFLKVFKIKDKEKTEAKGKDVYSMLCLPHQGETKEVENKQTGLMEKKIKFIDSLYKKDSANALPEVEKSEKKVKGVKTVTYDFTELEEALREIVKSVDLKLKSEISKQEAESFASAHRMNEEVKGGVHGLKTLGGEEDDDDLPF